MKKITTITALIAAMFISVASIAADNHEAHIKTQVTCPVMGGKINKSLHTDVNGYRIYVCCQGCISAIKKNPDKYIQVLKEKDEHIAKVQKKCPVMGGNINKNLFVDAHGKRIYVCCPGCIEKIEANPEKYIKALEEKGVVLDNVSDS